jgi:hypothetical protein
LARTRGANGLWPKSDRLRRSWGYRDG